MDRKHTALVFLDAKPERFRKDFRSWLEQNYHIYEEFERRAIRLAQTTWCGTASYPLKHLGAKSIWESMRYASAVRELSGEWKLNNTYTADCARLAMLMNPNLKGMFETRVGPLSARGL